MLVISVLEVLLWKIGMFLLLLKIFMKVNNRLCVGSEMFLANPRKLFSFAIYITLSCQILDIVITLVVDETHQSGKRLKSQRNSSQVHIKQVCAIWVFLFYERTAKSIQRRRSKLFCFTFDFDETFLDCSNHEYYSPTKVSSNSNVKQKSRL